MSASHPAISCLNMYYFFFFQAEDGIRDVAVTGVQTCALPICRFACDQVPAGDYTLYLNPGIGKPFTHPTTVEVPIGGTVQAQIGGTGRRVIGRFVASDPDLFPDWKKQLSFASLATKPTETAKPPV